MPISAKPRRAGEERGVKRALFLAALGLAAVLACASSASATHSNGEGPQQQLVAGTGTVVPPPPFTGAMVHVNAQSDAGGVDPSGHFWIRYPNDLGEFGGSVVCLNVVGNVAGLTGRIDRVKVAKPDSGFIQGNFVPIRITDFGEPGAGDMVNFDPGVLSQPPGCAGVGDLPISQGNYIVHDNVLLLDLAGLNLLLGEFETAADDPYGMG
jgi:hypothetical protein